MWPPSDLQARVGHEGRLGATQNDRSVWQDLLHQTSQPDDVGQVALVCPEADQAGPELFKVAAKPREADRRVRPDAHDRDRVPLSAKRGSNMAE